MVRLLLLTTGLILLTGTSLIDALTCRCSYCSNEDTCTDTQQCFYQISKTSDNEPVEVIRGCVVSTLQCNFSSDVHTKLCCNHSDNCNDALTAEIGQMTGTLYIPTSQPNSGTNSVSEPVLIPGLQPNPIGPDSSTSDPAPTLIVPFPYTLSPSCFSFNSEESDIIDVCDLNSYCYSTLRRTMDGRVISRRGCSTGTCVEDTRNRKVKRCCTSHMCNIELSVEEFFPDLVHTTSTPSTTNDTATPTTKETVSASTRIPPPILTPLTSTTEAIIPMATNEPTNELYCYCDGEDCIQNLACLPTHACGTEFTVGSGDSVISERRLCIFDQSECGKTDYNKYTTCCTGLFCNEVPKYEEIPFELFTTTVPPITEASTTPTSTTPTPQLIIDEDKTLIALTITLSVLAMILIVCVVSAAVTCYVKRRREKSSEKTINPPLKQHPNCYHENTYKDTSRSSVQSSVLSIEQQSEVTPSKEYLITSV